MTPSHVPKDFKVAIIGGGVCGLTCAIALAKQGVPVEIFEATTKFREIGAGLGLGPNSIRVLRELGVWDDVHAASGESGMNMAVYRYTSGLGDNEVLYDLSVPSEDFGLGIARYAFLDALLKYIDMSKVHFNKRCVDITHSTADPTVQILIFADGTRFEANVVLGADGIKSSVRSIITGYSTDSQVAWSNTAAHRALISFQETRAAGMKIDLSTGFRCFMGPGKHIVTFPIQGGRTINVVAFITHGPEPIGEARLPPGEPWVRPTSQQELLSVYDGWGPEVRALLSCVHKPSRWSICVVHPHLQSYVDGNVALLGDAAHAMLTHLGGGAGQCIEDAWVMARLLGSHNTNRFNLQGVLRVYDELRRPRSQAVWERSLRAGQVVEALGPSGFTKEGVQKDLTGIFDLLWHHELEEDVKEGLRRVAQLHSFNS
ncbi:hypothetical protein EIP91_011566 [Steccherinum ochraceum]|uniref:FAD-binding domain-containing protein n=1 Tax=Steccherinum ochraceum TaxID=92696 RepID=A0A4R0RM67_9APHY|nr:hypothetical protein EIP91_011566 [Steccherinum ochraceum]